MLESKHPHWPCCCIHSFIHSIYPSVNHQLIILYSYTSPTICLFKAPSPLNMTNLILLPNDILHALFTHLSLHKFTLRNLALAHPRFAFLIPPHLLSCLDLCIRRDDETLSPTFQLLLRTISERAELAALVRNLTLYWCSSWAPNPENDKIPILANDLLSRVRNLRSLTLLAGGPGELYMPLTFLNSNPMVHLHFLKLSDSETTVPDIFTYITSLPSLSTLHIDALNFSTPPPTPIVPAIQHPSAPLQTLHLDSFHLPASTLHALLLLPRALQTLHCLIPGRELREALRGGSPDSEMLEPLSPARVASCLQPAKGSLAELRVLANAGEDRWPGRDAGILDLKAFEKLKTLTVASELYFSDEPDRTRKGFYKLLPPSLEVLDVSAAYLNYTSVIQLLAERYKLTLTSSTSASTPQSSTSAAKHRRRHAPPRTSSSSMSMSRKTTTHGCRD